MRSCIFPLYSLFFMLMRVWCRFSPGFSRKASTRQVSSISHHYLRNILKMTVSNNNINVNGSGHFWGTGKRMLQNTSSSESSSKDGNSARNQRKKLHYEDGTINDIDHEIQSSRHRKGLEKSDNNDGSVDDMDIRLMKAQSWGSKRLSDEESRILNRAMKFEEDIDRAEQIRTGTGSRYDKKEKFSRRASSLIDENRENARIKGFLEINPYVCFGCGIDFQSKDENKPGYISGAKLKEHLKEAEKIRERQDAIKVLDLAGIELDSIVADGILSASGVSADTIASIRAVGRKSKSKYSTKDPKEVEEEGLHIFSNIEMGERDDDALDALDIKLEDLSQQTDASCSQAILNTITKLSKKSGEIGEGGGRGEGEAGEAGVEEIRLRFAKDDVDDEMKAELKNTACMCQRCYKMNKYGQVEEILRPGWSDHELLTPERFELLLSTIKDTSSVVLCIIDLFDLKGSLLPNLKQIVGKNPVVIAANKIDLFPKDVSKHRLTSWIYDAIKDHCGFISPKESERDIKRELQEHGWLREGVKEVGVLKRNNVHLVSCNSGVGMDGLLMNLMELASLNGNRVYVMGAANVGKSSFINRMLENNYERRNIKRNISSRHSRKTNKFVPQATVSNLPGTTLDFIKMRLPNGITMIDTPGLINRGQLTTKLNPNELKVVIPNERINAVTLRVTEGKAVMIGGLASLQLVDSRPFFFTFFVSNKVRLHPTDASRLEEIQEKHAGQLFFPPTSFSRMQEIGPFVDKEYILYGNGWKSSAHDIVIAGLGWVSITGVGRCKIKISVPVGTSVTIRPALMPFEASHSTAVFTGGRITRRGRKRGR